MSQNICIDTALQGPMWPDPVRVLAVDELGAVMQIDAVSTAQDQHRPFRALCIFLWALCLLLSGVGCDACARAMDLDPPERQRQRTWERYNSPETLARLDQQDRARQAAADRYRDQIVPGVGCEKCPNYCTLVDLRPIPYEEFARQFRQVVMDQLDTTIVTDSPESVIEHNRLTCILQSNESMKRALGPLLDAREHPRVRLEGAIFSIAFLLPAGDAEAVLFELAEGSDRAARMARSLIYTWNRDGWPEEQPYIEDDSGTTDQKPKGDMEK